MREERTAEKKLNLKSRTKTKNQVQIKRQLKISHPTWKIPR